MDNFKNNFIVDTSILIHLAQFNYVYPEFYAGAEMTLNVTGTNLIITEQCEREYDYFMTFSPTGSSQKILNTERVFTSAASTAALSSPYFFPSAIVSHSIVYQRGLTQNLSTTAQARIDSADSSVAQYSNYEYLKGGSSKIIVFSDNPNDIRTKLDSKMPLASSLDFIWGVVHHSDLTRADIKIAVELLREDSQKFKNDKKSFFSTDFWRLGARTLPGTCVFCNN
jgi:hypothetical protein